MGVVKEAPPAWVEPGRVAVPPGLEAFYEREYPRLVAALELLCADRLVAEELAQETLVRVWDRWPRVSRLESPGGWAHRVALNLGRSHLRRRRAEQRANRRSLAGQPQTQTSHDVSSQVAVREAMAALTVRQREAIVLRHYLGHTVSEAATVLGISEGSLRNLTSRAISDLRQRLGEFEVRQEDVL